MKSLILQALLFVTPTFAADINLLHIMAPSQLEALQKKEATVYQDQETGTLNITFRYVQGEPEVRIPTALMSWPTDWSSYEALEYTFSTGGLEPVAIGFSNGRETRFFRSEPLPGIRIKGVIPFESFVQTRGLTPLLPLGYKVWVDRLFDFHQVSELVFKSRYPNQPLQLTLYSLILRTKTPADEILDKRPLIDRYGQWIPENWPGKAHNDEQLRRLWDEERVEATDDGFCPLGGDPTRSLPGTGFFRTGKIEGKWALLDPHGHPFFSAGMDLVDPDASSFATDISRRQYLFEELPGSGSAWLVAGRVVSYYVANLIRRFGENWRSETEKHTVARLKSWGFNTIANWSDAPLAQRSGMPYALPLSGWTTRRVFPFPYDFPDVFSKEFEDNVDAAAQRQCEALKNDPNLIGWFVGNEPHWARRFGASQSWPDMLLADPQPSATQERLRKLLSARPEEAEKIKADFLYECAKKYFETVAAAIRKYDPNHLVLGIRFAERPNRRWAELSALFDVFSINIYSAEFAPDAAMVQEYSEASGRPVLIGEFTACAPGRGLQGLFYFTHKVRDQEERGKAYRYYVENSAASPFIIGTHWFQLVDDLPTGRPSDAERLNYGFLNVLDLPYESLVNAAKETHRRLYRVKFGAAKPYSEKPKPN
jgi:hypothetical protein